MFRYHGAYHTTFLIERDGKYYKQFNDWGFAEKWRDVAISRKEFDYIKASGREEADMAIEFGSDNIPVGAAPVWETHPVEYLTWHRDNDPPPYSERAAQALRKLGGGDTEIG